MTALVLYALLALGISTLCSLNEAGLLSLSRVDVARLTKEGRASGPIIRRMKKGIDRPLAAILTLNTIAHTVGAAGVGSEAGKIWGNQGVAIAGGVMTVLILVVSEILPKTWGAVHAYRLADVTAYSIRAMEWLTFPLIWLMDKTTLLGGMSHSTMSIHDIIITAQLGEEAGVIDDEEADFIENFIRMGAMPIGEVLNPREEVVTVVEGMTIRDLMAEGKYFRHSRMPLLRRQGGPPAGIVHLTDIAEAMRRQNFTRSLDEIRRPIPLAQTTHSVAHACDEMTRYDEDLVGIVDGGGAFVGLVTMEDVLDRLVEEPLPHGDEPQSTS